MPKWDVLGSHIDYERRVFGLDLLRSIAILAVVIEHSSILLSAEFPLVTRLFATLGFWGVELFFVLSGFLVGSILVRLFEREKGGLEDILRFWKRRWYRTLPNYYLFLSINVVMAAVVWNEGDISFLEYGLFLQNVVNPHPDFFGEAWTLAVEEWFYLLTPVLFALSVKIGGGKQKSLLYVVMLTIFVSILMRFNQHLRYPETDLHGWDILFRKIVVLRLDSIMFGVLGAYVMFYHQRFWRASKNIMFGMGILLLCCNFIIGRYLSELGNIGLFAKTIYFSSCSLSLLMLFPFCYYLNRPWIVIYTVVTWISVLSYSMYLIHYSLLLKVVTVIFPQIGLLAAVRNYFIYWFMLVLGALIAYRFVEKPIMDLREANRQINCA